MSYMDELTQEISDLRSAKYELEMREAALLARVERLRKGLKNAKLIIHGQVCGDFHHEFCIVAEKALSEDKQ